jgi:hypothetical protein
MNNAIGITTKKDFQNGDLRKLLKSRSPKKNGFRPQSLSITRPKPRMLTKETPSSKYDTSSAIYNSPKSAYPPPAFSSPEPEYPILQPPLSLCSVKTCLAPWSHWKYKRCDKCREKEKKQKERRKQRENNLRINTELLIKAWNSLPMEERLAGYMEQLRAKGLIASRRSNTILGKRKAEQDFAEHSARASRSNELSSDEYQNADELYDALRAVLGTGHMPQHFLGHFSVTRPLYEAVVKERVMDEAEELAFRTNLDLRCSFFEA